MFGLKGCGGGFGGLGNNCEILMFIILFLLLFCDRGFDDNKCCN